MGDRGHHAGAGEAQGEEGQIAGKNRSDPEELALLRSLYHPATEETDDGMASNVSSSSGSESADDSHDPKGEPTATEDSFKNDVALIRRLIPNRSAEEVEERLQQHAANPSRVQVVLNQLLEDPPSPNPERAPVPPASPEHHRGPKLKATKGMKVRNRGAGGAEPTAGPSTVKRPAVADANNPQDLSDNGPKQKKRKNEGKAKIEVTEDQMHGPFNFAAHRPEVSAAAATAMLPNSLPPTASRSPPLVDLGRTPSPPPVVEIPENAGEERRELMSSLTGMFPDTPREYLEEQVPDLAGKPAATERFISSLLERGSLPPEDWKPEQKLQPPPTVPLEETTSLGAEKMDDEDRLMPEAVEKETEAPSGASTEPIVVEEEETEPVAGPSNTRVETEEEKIERHFSNLEELFPDTDPEFLHEQAGALYADEKLLQEFIVEGFDTKAKNFPSRKDYEKRREHELLVDKYSKEMSVGDILEMYPDPEDYFGKLDRKVSDLYKKLSLAHLKREFRQIMSTPITQVWDKKKHLYYPAYKQLKTMSHNTKYRRKTRRPDVEAPLPPETDINFLKELQFCRIEEQVQKHKQVVANERQVRVDVARTTEELEECVCCYSDEVLPEEMVPCSNGHKFCETCVQRASEVAIGEGKTGLSCLGQCEDSFELATLQRALNPHMFSKWLKKIQLAEVEKADIDGLERCPFCEFATIMDTTPEEDKVFRCHNPECGKDSCRICKELNHIPLRCEEIEKDGEVRKRTYIENKMTEALIRHCYSCKKPFFKQDGCNKMTCECGAKMCYLCRKPVTDYRHFYGQGGAPGGQAKCPLWSDNKTLHDSDVAKGAFDAKSEMDQENPEVALKHDPTKGLQMPGADPAAAARRGEYVGVDMGHNPAAFIAEQQHIEAMIAYQRRFPQHHHHHLHGGPGGDQVGDHHYGRPFHMPQGHMPHAPPVHFPPLPPPPPPPMPPMPPPLPAHLPFPAPGAAPADANNAFLHRMGELLQLREAERQRHRIIRRREQQALELYRWAAGVMVALVMMMKIS